MREKRKTIVLITIAVLLATGIALLSYFFAFKKLVVTSQLSQPLSHSQLEDVESKLLKLLDDKDPTASFDYLRNALADNPSIARECHPLLHMLGRSAYDKYKDFDKAMSYRDEMCNSGYVHGVIEGRFKYSTNIRADLKTVCKAKNGEDKFQQWQCFHGVGHGVMYATHKNLASSIDLCESLSSVFAQKSCVNGVFMEEFIVIDHSGHVEQHPSRVNISLCMDQDSRYKADCYLYAPTAYLARNVNDYQGAFKECSGAEDSYLVSCIQGIGSQVVKENITRVDAALEVCKQAPQKYINNCVSGMAGLLLNHYASTEKVKQICDTKLSEFDTVCTQTIETWKTTFNF
jgi:hypothetical protein